DHVACDRAPLSIRVELDAAVGVVVDPVVADNGAAGLRQVDPMPMIRRREHTAFVDSVSLDEEILGWRIAVKGTDHDAVRSVLIGYLVVAENEVVGVDLWRPALGVDAVERHALDRRSRPCR